MRAICTQRLYTDMDLLAQIVIVDDERIHPKGDIHLKTSAEALSWLEGSKGCKELWLDHDLGGEDTTRPVALWLAELGFNEKPYLVEAIYIHSMNPVGADYLLKTLNKYYNVKIMRWF